MPPPCAPQVVTLAYSGCGALVTGDHPPVALGRLEGAVARAGLALVAPASFAPTDMAHGAHSSATQDSAAQGLAGVLEWAATEGGMGGASSGGVQGGGGVVVQHPVLPPVGGAGAALRLRPGRLLRFSIREVGAAVSGSVCACTPTRTPTMVFSQSVSSLRAHACAGCVQCQGGR